MSTKQPPKSYRQPRKTGTRKPHPYGKVTSATVKDAAAALGIGIANIDQNTKLVRDGNGLVNLDASYRQFKTLEDARHFREEVDTNIRLIRYARLRSEMISSELVARAWAEEWVRTRDAFLAFADRVCAELAAITDPKMIRQRLNEGYNETILKLRDTWTPPHQEPRWEAQKDEPMPTGQHVTAGNLRLEK